MRLTDVPRTTAFRLTLAFSGLLIGSVILLFGFIYWRTAVLLTHRLDDTLAGEVRELVHTPPDAQSMALDNQVDSDPHHNWQAGLFTADHRPLAGNLAGWPDAVPVDGKVHELTAPLPARPGSKAHDHGAVRVLATRLDDGRVLILARRADEVREVRVVILRALTAGLGAAVALALIGGLVLSYGSLRRIEAIHTACAAIMGGNLGRRLPVNGTGDDFDKLVGMVNTMLAEIERLIGDIKAAGDNIAHDLRTPLTRLRTRLEGALRRGGDLDAHRAAMTDAIADTDQILATFRALLRIGEIEDGQRRAGFAPVDLASVVEAAADLFEPLAADRGLRFIADLRPVPPVHGDADLLFEAVANLVDNALKFTPPGGTVRLTLAPGTGGAPADIVVADTGPGLPAERPDALFQRFTRGDKARHTPGNGLGLSLVAAVVRLHDAGLSIEDAGPGCRMRITLRRAAQG